MSNNEDIIAQLVTEVPTEVVQNNDGTYSAKHVLNEMIETIERVDLVDTLLYDLEDPLDKYIDPDTGKVKPLKVPANLYQVAICYGIDKASKTFEWKIARSEEEVFYVYNGVYWIRVSDPDMESFASKAATKIGYYSPAHAKTVLFRKQITKQLLSDAMPMHKPSRSDTETKINLLNGTLVFHETGWELKEHDHLDFQLYALPFEYDKNAKTPIFTKYLDRVLPDPDSQMVLQEFLGYVFTHHLKLEKALVLLGEGSNGKSVLFEIVTALFGPHNILTKSLGDLTDADGGNDARAKLADKLINYGSEIRAKDVDADIFKRLVSGEPVAAREKYKTGIDIENHCKFIFNANKLPKGMEKTHAYYRRLIIIPFTEKITDTEKDVELHRKIIDAELPGVLNWIIEGLERLLRAKAFSQCYHADLALNEYKKDNDPVLVFMEEVGLKPHNTDVLLMKDVYKKYKGWCIRMGHKLMADSAFGKDLKTKGFKGRRTASGTAIFAEMNSM